jgi:Xaa-Pro aminopeptidase
MKTIDLDPALFVENRRRLAKLLAPNSLAVLNANDVLPTNADGTMALHQNADLFYLTGVNQEETVLLVAPDAADETMREVLFVRETNDHLVTWEGHKLTKEQASRVSGVKNVRWLSDFPMLFRARMLEAENVYLNSNEHARAVVDVETRDARFVRDVQRRYPLHRYHRLARLMHELRAVKLPREVDVIRRACGITRDGFLRVTRFVRPGVNEAEVEAEFAHEFIRRRGGFAYQPIIAAGASNNVLHYVQNDQPCKAGQLLLLDVAAGYGNYMSDLTRTIPVSGRFTRRQRQVYDAVLRVFREISRRVRPGVKLPDLRKDTEQLVSEECLKLGLLKAAQVRKQDSENPAVRKYFMHGVAHPIGLDVHDVGFTQRPIAAGWVITVEPAIYVRAEGFGVRLENTVLVTADGCEDLMPDVPIEADDIERLMSRRREQRPGRRPSRLD